MPEGRAATCADKGCAIMMSGPHWHPPGRAAELVAGQEATAHPCRWTAQGVCITHDHMAIVCDEGDTAPGRRTTAAEGLRADIEKEKAREDRDAWSRGFVYGMQHALRMIEAEDA